MPTVGLVINETKPEAREAGERLARDLGARGVAVQTRMGFAGRARGAAVLADAEELARSDFVVILGGDGTLLAAARQLAPYGVALLGVHLGRFGFIAETTPDDLLPSVERALAGDYTLDERMLLCCAVRRSGGAVEEFGPGMNDVVVASGAVRMTQIRTEAGSDVVATYAADGVIVASPTGSTSYSLSAGGPLVHPAAPVLLITPISPHTLTARSLVVPDTETIHLTPEITDQRDVVIATVDGQLRIDLHPGDTVSVSRSPHRARLMRLDGPSFYHKLRARWHYGERLQG